MLGEVISLVVVSCCVFQVQVAGLVNPHLAVGSAAGGLIEIYIVLLLHTVVYATAFC